MITVDSRVGSRELLKYFPSGDAVLGRLEYGDFAFTGNGPGGVPWRIGIERKTIRDLLDCVHSGRFAGHQLPGLLNGYNEVHLVVEGCFKPSTDGVLMVYEGGKWITLGLGAKCYMMRDVWLWAMSISRPGVEWHKMYSPFETALFVTTLHRWWTWKEYAEHRAHVSPDMGKVASLDGLSFMRRIAAQLAGVRLERSKEIEKAFGSVSELVSATEEDWQLIPGIGKKLAASIVAELKGEK